MNNTDIFIKSTTDKTPEEINIEIINTIEENELDYVKVFDLKNDKTFIQFNNELQSDDFPIQKIIQEKSMKTIKTMYELELLQGLPGDIVYVLEKNRSGVFIWDETLSASKINNRGTLVHGWSRQFTGNIKAEWFKHAEIDRVYNANEWGHLISYLLRDIRADLDREIPIYSSKTLELPAGDLPIKTPIVLSQGVSLIGQGYRTNIICDFEQELIDHPEKIYIFGKSENIHAHYTIDKLEKVPMIYNWWLLNYMEISDFRLSGENKNVYGIYCNEMYYSRFNNINVRNTMGSGFTLIRGQFNTINMLSVIHCAGPIRIIGCTTLQINGLDIEGSKSPTTQLEIVHDSKWKRGINIYNFHQEEDSNGVYNPGDIIQIRQQGVNIYSMFAVYRSDLEYDRYFHLMQDEEYYFDGCTIRSVEAHDFYINDGSVGASVEFKVDEGLVGIEFGGSASGRFDYNKLSESTDIKTNKGIIRSSFRVLTNKSDKEQVLWCSSDTRVNFGDNSNRFIETDNSSLKLVNTYGRVKIKAGDILSNIFLQANNTTLYDKNGYVIADFKNSGITLLNEKLPIIVNNLQDLSLMNTTHPIKLICYHKNIFLSKPYIFNFDKNVIIEKHNGGTIIDPLKIFPTDWYDDELKKDWFTPRKINTTEKGCWVMEHQPTELNVEMFGAVSNNNFDDTQSIQATINYSYRNMGHYIYFSNGIFNVSKTIHLGWGDRYHNLNIIGDGPINIHTTLFGGTILYSTVLDAPTLNIQGGKDSTITNLTIFCEKYSQWIIENNLGGVVDEFEGDDSIEESWDHPEITHGRYNSQVAISQDSFNEWSTTFEDENEIVFNRFPKPEFPYWIKEEVKQSSDVIYNSSSIKLNNILISGFIIGIGMNVGGGDSNNDVFTIHNTIINYCKYGVSLGHSLSHNFNQYGDSSFFRVFCGYTNNHGDKLGNISGSISNVTFVDTINMFLINTNQIETLVLTSIHTKNTYRFGSLKSTLMMYDCKLDFNQELKNKPIPIFTFEGERTMIYMIGGYLNNGLFMVSCDPQLGFKMENVVCCSKQPLLHNKAEIISWNALQGGINPINNKELHFKSYLYNTVGYRVNSWQTSDKLNVSCKDCTLPAYFKSEFYDDLIQKASFSRINTNKFDLLETVNNSIKITPNTTTSHHNTFYDFDIGDLIHHQGTNITFYISETNSSYIELTALNGYFHQDNTMTIQFSDNLLKSSEYFLFLNSRTYLIDDCTGGFILDFIKDSNIVNFESVFDDYTIGDFIEINDRIMKQDELDPFITTNNNLYPKIISINEDEKYITIENPAKRTGFGKLLLMNKTFQV